MKARGKPPTSGPAVKNFITTAVAVCGHEEHHSLEYFTQWVEIGSGSQGVAFRTKNSCNGHVYCMKRICIKKCTKEEV